LIIDCWQGDPKLRPAFSQIIFSLEHMLKARGVNLTDCHASAQRYASLARSYTHAAPLRELKTAPSVKIEHDGSPVLSGANPLSKVARSHSMIPPSNFKPFT
jgi:hypothetical protein